MVNLGPLGMYLPPVGGHDTDPFRPITLHDIAPFVPAPETRCVFICEYCGSASESVNPCKNCLAPRTREQLELWARMGI